MPDWVCMVQEGQAAAGLRERLGDGLMRLATETFGDDAGVDIGWVVVPEGFGFTAGKPSTSSLIARSVPTGYPDDARVVFMRKVSDLWLEVTGCDPDEVVVTTLEGPLPAL